MALSTESSTETVTTNIWTPQTYGFLGPLFFAGVSNAARTYLGLLASLTATAAKFLSSGITGLSGK